MRVYAFSVHSTAMLWQQSMLAFVKYSFIPSINNRKIVKIAIFFFKVSSLDSAERKACEFIGVSEGYLSRQVSSNTSKKVCGFHGMHNCCLSNT